MRWLIRLLQSVRLYRSGRFRVVYDARRQSEPLPYDLARDLAAITGGKLERCDADA